MLRDWQFSLLTIFVVVTLTALLLGWWGSPLLLLGIQIVGSVILAEILVSELPPPIKQLIRANPVRLDGSRSTNREKLERQALQRLRLNLCFTLLAVLVPFNLLVWIARTEFASVTDEGDQTVTTVTVLHEFFVDPRFDWSLGNEYRIIVWALAFGWLIAGFAIFRQKYLHSLKRMLRSAKMRSRSYTIRDLTRLEEKDRPDLNPQSAMRSPEMH